MNFTRNKGVVKGLNIGVNRNFSTEAAEDLDRLYKMGKINIARKYEEMEKQKYEIRQLIAEEYKQS